MPIHMRATDGIRSHAEMPNGLSPATFVALEARLAPTLRQMPFVGVGSLDQESIALRVEVYAVAFG